MEKEDMGRGEGEIQLARNINTTQHYFFSPPGHIMVKLECLVPIIVVVAILLQLCNANSIAQVRFITPDTSLYLSYTTSPSGVFATGTIPRATENFTLVDYTNYQLTSGDIIDLMTLDSSYITVDASGSISFSSSPSRAFVLVKYNTTLSPIINDGDMVYLQSSTHNTCYPLPINGSLSCSPSSPYVWFMDVLPPTNRTFSNVDLATPTFLYGWVCQIGLDQNISIAMYIGIISS